MIDIMNTSLRHLIAPATRVALVVLWGSLLVTSPAAAQDATGNWRIGVSAGGYVPFSSLIVAADSRDTQLEAGPAFMVDAQYRPESALSFYASGILGFGSIRLGSSIQPSVVGPSSRAMTASGTAGLLLSASDAFGQYLVPTLRLGGGLKFYSFDVDGANSQARPTADIGVGLRGIGLGRIDVSAEVRYLMSTFDQAKLPTRGIAPQEQRQNDLVFSIGFGIRP